MRELDAQLVAPPGSSRRRARSGSPLATRDSSRSTCSARRRSRGSSACGSTTRPGASSSSDSPRQPASRAEAAYSLSKLARPRAAGASARSSSSRREFACRRSPTGSAPILTRALRFVGYPYVFSGSSEKTQKLWSATPQPGRSSRPGGFDCSGLIWRVFKLEPYAGAPLLPGVLKGRTTYAMSGEVAKPLRIDAASLAPGDIVFFGSKGREVEAHRDRARGHLRRQRLVRPLLERRRHAPAAPGLVRDPARLGAAPARRSRPRALTRCRPADPRYRFAGQIAWGRPLTRSRRRGRSTGVTRGRLGPCGGRRSRGRETSRTVAAKAG